MYFALSNSRNSASTGFLIFHRMSGCIVLFSVTPTFQTKNDRDLKFSTYTRLEDFYFIRSPKLWWEVVILAHFLR